MIAVTLCLLASVYAPTDRNILYVGRFDFADKTAPACEWSASEVRLRVRGSSLVASIDDTNGCAWEMEIDGKDDGPLPLKKGLADYTIDLRGGGDHDVRLVRRTESFMGPTRFKGFQVPDGKLLGPRRKKKHLEFVGDSITCGYGNEGKSQNERFSPATENAYESYASIAGRMLDADVDIIAWSGRKMWPNNTTPEIYDLIMPTSSKDLYNFKGPAPDAIVINLATNDFGRGAPDEAGWTTAYEAFIRRLWSHYPKAHIYAATGSMMYGDSLNTLKLYLSKIQTDINDKRFHRIDFAQQRQEDGYGADWHPNVKTDRIMAAHLAEVIGEDLKWPKKDAE